MKVIALSAKSGHGKDFCAGIIRRIAKEEFGKNLGNWSLAFPLKAVVFAEGAGDFTLDDVFNRKPPAVRRLLQIRGTEQGRNKYGEDYWLYQAQAFFHVFKDALPFMDGVIIPDARFVNEARFAQAGGIVPQKDPQLYLNKGMCLRITSDRPTLLGEAALHPSETSLDDFNGFDGYIVNDITTTADDLRNQLRPWVRSLLSS